MGGSTGAPGVRIVGRTRQVRMAHFGFVARVTINAHFTGTQASMDLNDGGNQNRFTVVVDGGAPKTVTSPAGQASLQLATGGERSAQSGGLAQHRGFHRDHAVYWLSNLGSGGALLAPNAAPDRRLEMIGDSLTVGAGVEGNACVPGGIDAFTNNYLAYGSIAARAVGADVVTIAWSGIGVLRNFDGSTTNIMPTRYPFAIPNDATAWDFTKYQPHVVVFIWARTISAPGDPGVAYETAYENFIKTVRSKYAPPISS